MTDWDPKSPETHPSLMSKTVAQLQSQLHEARDRFKQDQQEFGNLIMADAQLLLRYDRERIDTLRRAIKLKQEESSASENRT